MSSGVCLGLPMTMRRWIAVFESQDVPAVMVEGPFLRVSVIVSARSSGFLEAHNQKRMLRLSVRASSLPGLFEACREASMTGTPIEGVSAGADALVGRRVLRLNAAFRTLAGVDDDMRLATCEASDVIDAALRRWNARQSDPFADLWPTNLVDAEALDLARRALRRFLSDGVRAMSQNGVIDHGLPARKPRTSVRG